MSNIVNNVRFHKSGSNYLEIWFTTSDGSYTIAFTPNTIIIYNRNTSQVEKSVSWNS